MRNKKSHINKKTNPEDTALDAELDSVLGAVENATEESSGNEENSIKNSVSEDSQNVQMEDIESLQKLVSTLKNKVQESEDKALRSHAEMENVRRRSTRDVQNAYKYSIEKLVKELMPVIDSLEKALEVQSEDAHVQNMKVGVEMTLNMFIDTVKKFGLILMDPLGEVFDPQKHEAIAMQPNPEMSDNTVMTVFQKGYLLNDRVIRPARVVIVKN